MMRASHVAYGLELHASFPLAGMPPARGDGLPTLALERCGPAQLDRTWSGSDGPAWVGQLGDGCALTIERGHGGDTLFSYGDRALFHLDPRGERLSCVPLRTGLHWQQVLLGRILANVAIMRGYEALHASAVESPEGVVAIAAPSGTGKTTLALELLRRGWPLFTDDVLALGEGGKAMSVCAHPGTPHMNIGAGLPAAHAPPELGTTLGILAGERWTAVHTVAHEARSVRMVCLLERGPQLPLAAQTLPAHPLPLAPYMLGLADDAGRERQRFSRYADLMSGATLVRLTCDSATAPAAVADVIELALAEHPALAVGASR